MVERIGGALCRGVVIISMALLIGGEATAADPDATKEEKPSEATLQQLIKKLESQNQTLLQQQKRLAEQEKKLEEYKAALEQALTEHRLRLRQLEQQRGTGAAPVAASTSAAEDQRKKERAQRAEVVAQAKTEPGPDEPIGQPPETVNRPPEIAQITQYPGVLTPRGRFVLEPALQYAYSSNDRVALTGFAIVPAIAIGAIDIQSVNRDLFIASLTARYGLTDRLEVEAKVPYVYRQDSTTGRPLLQQSFNDSVFNSQASGIGDVEFTGRYQLNQGGPDSGFYVASLRVKTVTGKGPFDVPTTEPFPGIFVQSELPTGTGFYAVQPGITALFASDPAVFFGGASYIWNIKRHVSEAVGDYDPGDGVTVNFGMGLSLNERASFSIGYEHDIFFKDKQNGQYVLNAQTEHLGTLLIGYSYRLSKTTTFSLTLGVGVTDQAPDVQLTARLPVMF